MPQSAHEKKLSEADRPNDDSDTPAQATSVTPERALKWTEALIYPAPAREFGERMRQSAREEKLSEADRPNDDSDTPAQATSVTHEPALG